MKKYEIIFIVNPSLDETTINTIKDEVTKTIESNNGKILETKDMGQRELAYEIEGHKKGYYFLIKLDGTNNTINSFNHVSNVNENIIRSLVTKIEDKR